MSSALESASREDLLAVVGLIQQQHEQLTAANERLTAGVAEFERRLGRDWGNCSMKSSRQRDGCGV
ncbi:hypothetical protein QBA35_41585 [Streptomyces bottropensis]|uniref:Transposase n=1 Tax=Streptomyces bottropensis TaxID=42235 RepID=A0ABU8B114_9ACTN